MLRRRLGIPGATAIGVSAMLGAGVFVVLGPAAASAGDTLLVAVGIAGLVAILNAAATAQLAAQHPVAGGAYAYGRARLGPWPGFLAGWSFVVGKTASCAAVAWTIGATLLPGHERVVAVVAVAAVTALALAGVARTAVVSCVLAALVVTALAVLVVTAAVTSPGDGAVGGGAVAPLPPGDLLGTLQAAGLLFFAFAGYARVATLGEEVRRPARTIPRSVALSLGVVLALYLGLALVLERALGAGLARSMTPVADLAVLVGGAAGGRTIAVVAVLACGASLLALVAGIARTSLAMARTGDMPRGLATVSPRGVPVAAEVAVGLAVTVVALVVDLRGLVAFSSFGVLLYYAVANASALTQVAPHRRLPRIVPAVGLLLCVLLVATLPRAAVLVGLGVLALGVVWRILRIRLIARSGAARDGVADGP